MVYYLWAFNHEKAENNDFQSPYCREDHSQEFPTEPSRTIRDEGCYSVIRVNPDFTPALKVLRNVFLPGNSELVKHTAEWLSSQEEKLVCAVPISNIDMFSILLVNRSIKSPERQVCNIKQTVKDSCGLGLPCPCCCCCWRNWLSVLYWHWKIQEKETSVNVNCLKIIF